MAIFDNSFLIEFLCLNPIPNIVNTLIELLDTKPLAPTSIVLQQAAKPFDFASSTRSMYFSRFLSFHRAMFSSAGDVNSIKQTFFAVTLCTQMYYLVLAMEGGTWYCVCLVSIRIFQSSNEPQ